MLLPTVFLFTLYGISTTTARANCEISLRGDVDKLMPLVLSQNFLNILYPVIPAGTSPTAARKVVTIKDGGRMSIACPDRILMIGRRSTAYKTMTILCNNGKFDTDTRKQILFNQLQCSGTPKPTIRLGPPKLIGFQIPTRPNPNFITMIQFTQTNAGFFTGHRLDNSAAYSSSIDRKSNFLGGTCKINGRSADTYYKRPSQQAAINRILGLPATSNDYVSNQQGSTKYLARGHLSPVGDFLYPAERDATNICDNMAPQWQSINNGNWRTVEAYVREIALYRGHLFVRTGVHQVASLRTRFLYLAPNNQLPVPKYYWKIVVDGNSNTVVFITLNNPYEANMVNERRLGIFRLCNGSCSGLRGLNTADFANIQKGLTECCQCNNQILGELGVPAIASRGLLSK